MSFKAVIELFLQVHDFVNIDLPTQGIFRLRVSAYEQTSKSVHHCNSIRKYMALPLSSWRLPRKWILTWRKCTIRSRSSSRISIPKPAPLNMQVRYALHRRWETDLQWSYQVQIITGIFPAAQYLEYHHIVRTAFHIILLLFVSDRIVRWAGGRKQEIQAGQFGTWDTELLRGRIYW